MVLSLRRELVQMDSDGSDGAWSDLDGLAEGLLNDGMLPPGGPEEHAPGEQGIALPRLP